MGEMTAVPEEGPLAANAVAEGERGSSNPRSMLATPGISIFSPR